MKKCKLNTIVKGSTSGITLIALVITVVILIILAAVGINLIFANDGIVSKALQSGEGYSESAAKEKLLIALADLSSNKVLDSTYNETEYLDNYLQSQGFIVNDNIVSVDNWQFQIDRNIPEIVMSLGKGIFNNEIAITVAQTVASDYAKSTVHISIAYSGEIESIQLGDEYITVPEKANGIYVTEKDLLENGTYTLYVNDTEGGYQIDHITISQLSENMELSTAEGLVAFRNRVNAGETFEGRTITLATNIDLSSVCGSGIGNWIPIGTTATPFKGMFNGNNHEILNLYIDNTGNPYQGLFGYIKGSEDNSCEIRNLIMNSSCKVYGRGKTACVVAEAEDATINYCTNNGEVKGYNDLWQGGICGRAVNCQIYRCVNTGAISGHWSIGGILGEAYASMIKECYNTGAISKTTSGTTYSFGGIVGNPYINSQVVSCYNLGTVTGNYYVGGVVGCNEQASVVQYCYNRGTVSGTQRIGAVVGYNSNGRAPYANIYNCYFLVGSASVGVGGSSGGSTQTTSKTAAELSDKTSATTSLKNSLNNMNPEPVWTIIDTAYPILNWQVN